MEEEDKHPEIEIGSIPFSEAKKAIGEYLEGVKATSESRTKEEKDWIGRFLISFEIELIKELKQKVK